MPVDLLILLLGAGALALGGVIGLYALKPRGPATMADFEQKADNLISKNRLEAERIKNEVAGRINNIKTRIIEDETKTKERFKRLDALVVSKEDHLGKRQQKIQEIKQTLDGEVKIVEELRTKSKEAEKLFTVKLAQKCGQNTGELKAQMLSMLGRDLELEKEDKLRKYEEQLNEDKERIAKNMITDAIQRYSSPTSVEKKATSLTVPRDEIKGRILGKNAENIKLFEELAGVDVIFNDAPNTIIISCFDLVKKHVALETIN